jgi:hypothetical protein
MLPILRREGAPAPAISQSLKRFREILCVYVISVSDRFLFAQIATARSLGALRQPRDDM